MCIRNLRICIFRALLAVPFFCSFALAAEPWQPLGPEGGTVRSLAFDPKNPERIFLGTSAGRLYLSSDGGGNWTRLVHLGSAAEMVLDHIVIDPANPRNIYVAAWNAQDPNNDGDLYRSKDGGRTWDLLADMHGQSVRALAMSASDSRILVAGVLDGVFRSRDGGDNWERISPEHHAEIKNVESVAIDPLNPDVIYAGTWHLPWKTEDGGKTWHSIKKGVIDDSDVFTIVIDSQNTSSVYISACSGIYRSESGGDLFRKIQGIPYSARRTRSLQLDPSDHRVVYAGTTEGLWKTTDAGVTWKRMTGANVVVNDVMIDPRKPSHLLLATDRGGVLSSDDGGATFTASNRGFTHRQVAALLVDHRDSSIVYAGVLNDKEFGGVFVSRDRGELWRQMNDGMDGRDVFVLRQAPDNSLLAGTDRGVFQLRANSSRWSPINLVLPLKPEDAPEKKDDATPKKKNTAPARTTITELTGRVSALEAAPDRWFAATSIGFFDSTDSGATWRKQDIPGLSGVRNIAAAERMVVVASRNAVAVSVNAGESWLPFKPFDPDFQINSVAISPDGDLWIAAREGVFRSTDAGDSWKRVLSLRLSNVVDVRFDENGRILAVGADSTSVYESLDNGRTWSPINSGWLLRNVQSAHGRLLATTPFDGVIIQPDTSASASQIH